MTINVVFTGPAFDGHGHAVLRANLVSACKAKGNFLVQTSVRDGTDVLVASRSDTVKAKVAAARGVTVLGYPEFIARFLTGVEIETTGAFNPHTDKLEPSLLVPCFVTPEILSALDQI